MSGFFSLILFLVVLVIGFVFEWQKGALEWNSRKLSKLLQFSQNHGNGCCYDSYHPSFTGDHKPPKVCITTIFLF